MSLLKSGATGPPSAARLSRRPRRRGENINPERGRSLVVTHFQALEVSIAVIRSLRAPIVRLRRADPDLARQLRRALASASLNLAEGNHRTGRDRGHHWRVALGGLEEARTALRVADAFGYLRLDTMDSALKLLDRCVALVWGLAH